MFLSLCYPHDIHFISFIDIYWYPRISFRYPRISFRYPWISFDILIKYPYNIPKYLLSYPNQLSEGYSLISQDNIPFSPSLSCRPAKAAGMGPTMCAHPDNTAGSMPAHIWPHGTTFGRSAPTGAVAGSSLCGRPATAAGKLPWARGLAVLFTIRMTACMPSLGLWGLFLAALHRSQNQ